MTKFDDDETRLMLGNINAAIQTLDLIRQMLDRMSSERGIPIKHTVARINKAKEFLVSARDYWDHDVISGYGEQTKIERQRTEQAELS